jgi:hypothetical protein
MKAQLPGDTLLIPRAGQRRLTSTGLRTTALAPELLTQSVRRLRVLAFLYAFTFFMAGFFPSLLVAEDRARLFQETLHWVPGVVSIAMALLVAAFTLMKDVPLTRVLNVGLAFEIVSSYGIALAEYIEPMRLNTNGWMGLSWVAVWTVLFTVFPRVRGRRRSPPSRPSARSRWSLA